MTQNAIERTTDCIAENSELLAGSRRNFFSQIERHGYQNAPSLKFCDNLCPVLVCIYSNTPKRGQRKTSYSLDWDVLGIKSILSKW